MKHTPGSWKVDEFCGTIIWADNAYENAPFHVADIRGWGTLQKLFKEDKAIEIQNANARLIAAAPEMYDMLECCADWFVRIAPSSTCAQEAVRRCRVLLDKIDGGK